MTWVLGHSSLGVWHDLLDMHNIFSLHFQGQFLCVNLLKEEVECSPQGEVGPNIISFVLADSYLDQTNQFVDPSAITLVVWKLLFCVMENYPMIVSNSKRCLRINHIY